MKSNKKEINNIVSEILDDLDIYVSQSTTEVISGDILYYIKNIESSYISEIEKLKKEIKNISFEYRKIKRQKNALLGIAKIGNS